MNPLTLFVVACLAFASAQTQTADGTSGGAANPPATTAMNNPISGPLGVGGLGAGPLSAAGAPPANNPANGGAAAGGINPMLLALGGGDNLYRALMLPSLSRLGRVNQYYFLRGGMDKMAQSMMSDMMSRMLTRSMPGMSPLMAPMLTSQIFDAPDGWFLSNMLFNRNRGGQMPGGGMNNGMGGGLNSLFGGLFGGQPQQTQSTGQGMQLPVGAASPSSGAQSGGGGFFSNPMGLLAMSMF